MKNIFKRGLALLLIVMMIVSSISISAFAAVSRPQANTGIRDQVCTSFNNTTAPQYYTGSYTYDNLVSMSSSGLKSALNTLMTSTHKNTSTYDNCRDYSPYTDCEGGDTSHFTMLYTSYSATYSQYNQGQGWNREHVWPQSLGGGNTSGGGADLHHIRPDEAKTNSTRGNRKYGNVNGGSNATGNLSGMVGGQYGGKNLYEPLDNVKGDVARICLYVHVRWGSAWGASSITSVFESVDTLLEWCALDPVDTWEMERNDVVQGVQGNRNVFIDYPELAWELFDRTIPSNMTTPSGKASGGSSGGSGSGTTPPASCTHTSTTTVNAQPAGCNSTGYTGDIKCTSCGQIITKGTSILATGKHTEITVDAKEPSCIDGYTGDKRCKDCNVLISSGTAIPATSEHKKQVIGAKDATCKDDGYTGDITCQDCGTLIKKGSLIHKHEDHTFDVWMEVTPATETQSGIMSRHCFICGFGDVGTIPKLQTYKGSSGNNTPIIIISIVAPVVLIGAGIGIFFAVKKKKD